MLVIHLGKKGYFGVREGYELLVDFMVFCFVLVFLTYTFVEFTYQHFQWMMNHSLMDSITAVARNLFLKNPRIARKAVSFNLPYDTELHTAQIIGF